ncbi:hypothetical protein MSKU15_2341 [Komagataeibacter diospyri]|nr:hypothetical protein MSKU15_2341 [Komagataeibacter diospyri]
MAQVGCGKPFVIARAVTTHADLAIFNNFDNGAFHAAQFRFDCRIVPDHHDIACLEIHVLFSLSRLRWSSLPGDRSAVAHVPPIPSNHASDGGYHKPLSGHVIPHPHKGQVATGERCSDMKGQANTRTQEYLMSSEHHLPSATDLQRELEQVRRDYAIALKDRPEHARALEERARKLEAELAHQK